MHFTTALIALIAMVAHEINRAYCQALGDTSQLPWADAPQWQKDSAIAGVNMHLANPNATPADSHASWLAQKLAEGWVYGPVKDAELKQHPCCLPYDELPAEQKAKDYIFRGAVHSASAALTEAAEAATKSAREVTGAKVSGGVSSKSVAKAAAGEVSVSYIGRRPTFTDHLYGSGLSFEQGQSRNLPAALAGKLLRHGDMFQPAAADAAVLSEPAAPEAQDDTAKQLAAAKKLQDEQHDEQGKLQDLRDSVQNMDKAALRHFAMTHYQREFGSRDSLGDMRGKAIGLIDQYGAI